MIKKLNCKEKTLVTVVLYRGKVLGVASSLPRARAFAKRHVVEAGYYVDQFEFLDTPRI